MNNWVERLGEVLVLALVCLWLVRCRCWTATLLLWVAILGYAGSQHRGPRGSEWFSTVKIPEAAGWTWTWICASAFGMSRGNRVWCPPRRLGVLLVFLCGLCRVGEAAHPGPGSVGWSLGIANPSGLNSKVDQVAHLGGDSWILSETQLSAVGFRNFVKGLKAVKSPWKSAIPGAPCPPRNQYGTGNHTGVMLLSQFPARALPHQFADQTFPSARLQVAGMMVDNDWVTLGMLYGLPANAQHQHAKYQTEVLLSELVDRVACQASGPRAIGGDFNFSPHELDQTKRLLDLRFREVQELAALRWGQSVVATGRGKRCLDQLWISPELQVVLQGVQVRHDDWADHATVVAQFKGTTGGTFPFWRMPQPFPWPSDWNCPVDFDPNGDLTVEYAGMWAQVEGHACKWNAHHGLFCSRGQLGRGQTLELVPKSQYRVPNRKSRPGEVTPAFMGVSLQHARFFKQLRRLQALSQQLGHGIHGLNAQLNRNDT